MLRSFVAQETATAELFDRICGNPDGLWRRFLTAPSRPVPGSSKPQSSHECDLSQNSGLRDTRRSAADRSRPENAING
jgi:hypothetical protein